MGELPHTMLPDPERTFEIDPVLAASWVGFPEEVRPLLIDCREEDEWDICRIDGSRWIPLRQIPSRLEAIRDDAARGVVVVCHHGVRSLHATDFLRRHGIDRTFSLRGGIDRWSHTIDPTVLRY